MNHPISKLDNQSLIFYRKTHVLGKIERVLAISKYILNFQNKKSCTS